MRAENPGADTPVGVDAVVVLIPSLIKAKTESGYPSIEAEAACGQETVSILPAMV